MTMTELGYQKDLFILPFDHRGSFESGLLGIRGRHSTTEETKQLAAYKQVIFEGFLEAIKSEVPADTAAILVDLQYGSDILADANQRGITTCTCLEKSGQDEFDFEYGSNFLEKLKEASPTFGKVLVRYNPEGDSGMNAAQRQRLKQASDSLHPAGFKFMFELLVPATSQQLASVGDNRQAYDSTVRPNLMAQAITELQQAGIEPDVWKLEGMDDGESAQMVADQARAGGRDRVGIIILGRGEDAQKVDHWLKIGAQTRGVIGFAVGRTTFWEPVLAFKEDKISRADAVSRVAANYTRIYQLFVGARVAAR